jgi:hypothetical protein
MKNTFTAVFEKVDDWYIGYVEELSGPTSRRKPLRKHDKVSKKLSS